MKRLGSIFLVLFCLISMFGCASSAGGPAIPASAKPAIDMWVAVARGLADVGLSAELKKHGASDTTISATIDSLHKAVDDLIAGKSVTEVISDSSAWTTLRSIGVSKLGALLHTTVPAISESAAEQLIGSSFDVARAYLLTRIPAPAPPAVAPQASSHGTYLCDRPGAAEAIVCHQLATVSSAALGGHPALAATLLRSTRRTEAVFHVTRFVSADADALFAVAFGEVEQQIRCPRDYPLPCESRSQSP